MSDNKEVTLIESKPDEEFYKHLKLGLIYKGTLTKEEIQRIMEEING